MYPGAHMADGGRRDPVRLQIEIRQTSVSEEEAVATIAAIEQFLHDAAPPPAPAGRRAVPPWGWSALREGVGVASDSGAWGHAHPRKT